MTNQGQELDPNERRVLEARWNALIEELRWLALKLGYPNPFPKRKERRQFQKEPDD